jgi:hypothetical protein
MSVWATILVLDDEHTQTCTIWRDLTPTLRVHVPNQPCNCGQPTLPYLYRGSHIVPAATDPRGGDVQLALVPSHITRDARDDGPWPWLRLSTSNPDTILNVPQAASLSAALTDWLTTQQLRDDSFAQRRDADGAPAAARLADTGRGWAALFPAATEATDPAPLTGDEARALVDELGLDLYRAQDALQFVGECCDIADREQQTITTADVREWLKGARCARQLAADATRDCALLPPAERLLERLAEATRAHHLCTDRAEADADGNAPCTCGNWREPGPVGSDGEDWDSHMATVTLTVLQERLELGEEHAWCKTCRRMWEGPEHCCDSDAEATIHLLRNVITEMETDPAARQWTARLRNALAHQERPAGHVYLSTSCLHGDTLLPDGRTGHEYCASPTGNTGTKAPASCKFCAAPCHCSCHTPKEPQP